jgi:hypothetical protein
MGRVTSPLRRRVPIYVWLPIILACAVAGSIASTLRPVPPITSPPHVPRAEKSSQSPLIASPAEEAPRASSAEKAPRTAESQLSSALDPPREPAVIALPTEELDLPSPSVVERQEQVPAGIAPRTPVPKVHAKVGSNERSAAKARRPQRMSQRTVKVPSKSAGALNNVPIIGPMFSLLQ